MEKFSFRQFVTDKEYRAVKLMIAMCRIKYVLLKPLARIEGIVYMIKLYRDYPNSWDRYVKMKEDEERTRRFIEMNHLIGSITCYLMSLVSYTCYKCGEAVETSNWQDFEKDRAEILTCIDNLKEMRVEIPDELLEAVNMTQIDDFDSIEAEEEYSRKLYGLYEQIEF